jgi:hypothetical protein
MQFERYQVLPVVQGVVIELKQAANAARFFILVVVLLATAWWFGPYGIRPSLSLGFYWGAIVFLGVCLMGSVVGFFYSEEFRLMPGLVMYRNTFGKSRTIHYNDVILARVKVASSRARSRGSRVFYYQVPLLESNGAETELKFSFNSEGKTKQFILWVSDHVSFHVVDVVDEDIFREKPLKGFLDNK